MRCCRGAAWLARPHNQKVTTMSKTEFERITCDDVRVGDKIARARSHVAKAVVHINEGGSSRRLFFTWHDDARRPGRKYGDNIRPRRDAKLWRVVAKAMSVDAAEGQGRR
jgi:hypothetical protein